MTKNLKDEAMKWYNSLTDNEKTEIALGYNKMIRILPIGVQWENFIQKSYKVLKTLDKKKWRKTFNAAEKVGKILMKKED